MRDDAKDAARYRWLREAVKDDARQVQAQTLFWNYSSRRDLDKALDEIMSARAEPSPKTIEKDETESPIDVCNAMRNAP